MQPRAGHSLTFLQWERADFPKGKWRLGGEPVSIQGQSSRASPGQLQPTSFGQSCSSLRLPAFKKAEPGIFVAGLTQTTASL